MGAYRKVKPPVRLSRRQGIALLYGGMTAIAVVAGQGLGQSSRWGAEGWPGAVTSVGLGTLLALVIIVASRLSLTHWRWAAHMRVEFRELIGPLGAGDRWLLAFASGVGEELFFRGWLLPWLGPWVQAVAFALLHIGPHRHMWPWTLFALSFALATAALTMFTGSLLGAIVAHVLVNAMNLKAITGPTATVRPPGAIRYR